MDASLAASLVETFRLETVRTGIHQPLLMALYDVHTTPVLPGGLTGLGVIPVNQIRQEDINAIAPQIQVAATTLQSLTQALIAQGWQADDLWDAAQGNYTNALLHRVANGYIPDPADPAAARLELCAVEDLYTAYHQRILEQWQAVGVMPSQAFLDEALLFFVKQLPADYFGLAYQQQAVLEGVRLWQEWGDREQTTAQLTQLYPTLPLDAALLRFVQTALPTYNGYPHQREALLRLAQLWLQLSSREQTIWALEQGQTQADTATLDTALITFVQHLPQWFLGTGEQRNALVEGFRYWKGLASRPEALMALGVDPDLFSGKTPDPIAIDNATHQTDQALIEFVHHVPALYSGSPPEQAALLHLAQLWHNTPNQAQTRQRLMETLKQTESARRDSVDALPKPLPNLIAFQVERPSGGWSADTLPLNAAIAPDGSFTWASATCGGLYLPTDPAIIERIEMMAHQVQQVRDRLGRPLTIVCWYSPPHRNPIANTFLHHRHHLGDAIIFYCDGLTGQQLYWGLTPWWRGKLAYHVAYPHLCYIDARSDRARQVQR